MKALRTFHVETQIPDELSGLTRLAHNLRWSWHTPTLELFRSLHPQKFAQAGGNPVALLSLLTDTELSALAADPQITARVQEAANDLDHYLDASSWFASSRCAAKGLTSIAYFSAEYGITEVLPQYSGGLGILAGDHLKSASDLGVPLTAVGLFYKSGYFHQSLNRDGWQTESYPVLDVEQLPVELLREADGTPVSIELALPDGRTLHACVRTTKVGRVTQLLLDTDVEGNDRGLRDLTFRLYGGGGEQRLQQELLLGIGGVRALRAYTRITAAPEPQVYHCNEGHAGFLGLERISELVTSGLDFDTALRTVRAGSVFTTHTPVPAGIDRFGADLVRSYFSGVSELPGVPTDRVMELGSENFAGGDAGVFNMAVMGLRLAQRANGVSLLHGEVSRGMFKALWPGFDEAEVPITSITNGVHGPTWLDDDASFFAGPNGSGGVNAFGNASALDDAHMWETKRKLRSHLVTDARARMRASGLERGFTPTELGWTDHVLDENILTIGFARRVPTYKRLTLMLRDPERLARILTNPDRPVQLVVAGKAHPADEQGKRLIQQLVKFADREDVRHRIVFMPNYDISMARTLYPGCDVWLNNPLRPFEASGTSGMKAAINGALNLSILDGWWDEWYADGNGWAIPTADGVTDPDRRDDLEAAALYDLIEKQVAPTFYDVDEQGVPREWLRMIKHTLGDLGPKVMATRMVRDYTSRLYTPAAESWEAFRANDFELAKTCAGQARAVQDAFARVRVDAVELDAPTALRPGDAVRVEAYVSLGGLDPKLVHVQALTGVLDSEGNIAEAGVTMLEDVEPLEGDRFVIRGDVTLDGAGSRGLAVRIVPNVAGTVCDAELGLVVNAQ